MVVQRAYESISDGSAVVRPVFHRSGAMFASVGVVQARLKPPTVATTAGASGTDG